ncbi:hypothetical protein T12_2499 [Trichinella patagoniensis]|uniref:Uncharacterized protein n=1 Tax=Trichinella patagoniensis TaxID=990121 RepID=A0A0V0ZVD9_9BILA|nr:hypothetical protein T12_2499 [Trichinella patagoniensis]
MCTGFLNDSAVATRITAFQNAIFIVIHSQLPKISYRKSFSNFADYHFISLLHIHTARYFLHLGARISHYLLANLINLPYSIKLRSFVQYFYVLGKFIFLDFPSIWNKFIEIVSGRHKCYWNQQILPGDVLSSAQVSFPSLTSPLKSHHCTTFLQYLGKYVFVRRETRTLWKVLLQTNPYLLNKWPLKFACAYLNTQESSPSGTPLKRLQDGNVFYIILRYSMNLRSLVQYIFILGKSIFLHFPSIWNKFIEIVSARFGFKFWKVLLQTNPYLLNKWPLKFACAYLNTQESSPSGTPLKRLQDG